MPQDAYRTLKKDALALLQGGDHDKAESILIGLIKNYPATCDDLIHLATINGLRSDWESLENFSRKALEINPQSLEAQNNLAIALKNKGDYQQAIKIYSGIISRHTDLLEPYLNLANALQQTGQLNEAINTLKKSLKLETKRAEIYNQIAVIYCAIGDEESTAIYLELAIKQGEANYDAYVNYGNLLSRKGCFTEALEQYHKALSIDETNGLCLLNIANTLQSAGCLQESLSFYKYALERNHDSPNLYYNLGLLLVELNQLGPANEAFEQAYRREPNNNIFLSQYIMVKKKIANWQNIPSIERFQEEYISKAADYFDPFFYLGHVDSPQLQLMNAKGYSKKVILQTKRSLINRTRQRKGSNGKLKVGYFSSNFNNHPTTHLIKGVLREHTNSELDIYLFDTITKRDTNDPYLKEIQNLPVTYIYIGQLSFDEMIRCTLQENIDVAVDLMGHAENQITSKIFSSRIATAQINYLGFPGTTGSREIHDFIIADDIVIPKEHEKYYCEKVVRISGCYQCNDNKKSIADPQILGSKEPLLEEAEFVFCCFNNIWKITSREFDIWMRLLINKKNSVLWLLSDEEMVIENLRREAYSRSVSPDRLVFAKRVDLDMHLARHQWADLFLDTFAYNAHTTASDALWAGLPVLTMKGNSFPSRVSASILTAAGLPELIKTSEVDYESQAQWLANHPDELQKIKDKLNRNRLKCSLFDTVQQTRNLEKIYIDCWEKTVNLCAN